MPLFSPRLLCTAVLCCAALPAVQAQEAPARRAAAVQRFDILQYTVEGNTVLPAVDIERAVYPFLGEQKTLAEVEGAKRALEQLYQERGYLSVVVTVPPQASRNGEIRLEVIEARVDTLKITGAQYHRPSEIRAATPSLAPGEVPHFPAVQADLARVQNTPDVLVTPLISAGDDPRKLNVELKVQDQLPVHGSLEVNNKQSFNTARGRLEAGLRYDNLWQRDHSLGVNWIYSPRRPKEANTLVLNYAIPFYGEQPAAEGPDRLSFVLVSSRSNTPTSLGGATVVRGETYGLRWRSALPAPQRDRKPEPGESFSHGGSLGVDLKHNRDGNENVAGFNTRNPDLRYPVAVLAYDLVSLRPDATLTTFDATLTIGSSGLGGRDVDCHGILADQFDCKRLGASADFQTLRFNLLHRLPVAKWKGTWNASFKLQGQLATGRLVSAEQIGFGGMDTVRGYYEYEQVGDQGLLLRSQLDTPPWRVGEWMSVSALAFFDRAMLRIADPLPTEQSYINLGSWGLGLEAQSAAGLLLRIDFAVPVLRTRKADSSGTLNAASGDGSPNRYRWDLTLRQAF